jgi:uncharacterized membrane protein
MITQIKLFLLPFLLKFKIFFAFFFAMTSVLSVVYIYDVNQKPAWTNKESVEILEKSVAVTVGKVEQKDTEKKALELMRISLLSSAMAQITNSFELDKKDADKMQKIQNAVKKLLDATPIHLQLETTSEHPLYTMSREKYESILQDIYIEISYLGN